MPDWLVSEVDVLTVVAAKAALMYVVVLLGLRLAHRRTLAQWTAIDFAAAVAIGALLGRTAVAEGQSFLAGAVALVTILGLHYAATMSAAARCSRGSSTTGCGSSSTTAWSGATRCCGAG